MKDIAKVIPGWNDPATQRKLLEEMKRYAKYIGFTDAEMQVNDRKILLTVYKAMMYDKISILIKDPRAAQGQK